MEKIEARIRPILNFRQDSRPILDRILVQF